MSSQAIKMKVAAAIVALLAILASSGCSVKEERSECPLLVTIWPEEGCRATGSAVIWFCDGIVLNASLQAGEFDSTVVVDFPVKRNTDRIYVWGNLTSRTKLDLDNRKMTVSDKDCDSLYCAEAFPVPGAETFRQEMHFKRMYAKLLISVTGYETDDPPVRIRVRSSTTGYLADKSVIEGPSILESLPTVGTKGIAEASDTSHFTANLMRQSDMESLTMSVISRSGSETSLPLGSMMAQILEGAESEDAFFKDYYILVDLEHCTVSMDVTPWESELSFRIEY